MLYVVPCMLVHFAQRARVIGGLVVDTAATAISASQLYSNSSSTAKTPKTPFITFLTGPMSMKSYFDELPQLAKPQQPLDSWLPITESRNGNAYYAAFHTLSSGIGIQALALPVAFATLGWTSGILCLLIAFTWQLYTLWLLIQLHEQVPGHGRRYSRYLQLSKAAFGEKLGKVITLLPVMYLSGGTCVTLIIVAGGAMKLLFQTLFENTARTANPLTQIEWYLVFTCLAILLAQLPNLNSIAGVSLIGALTALCYCTMIWAIPVSKGRAPGVSYEPLSAKSEMEWLFGVFNALGVIALAFRGHNLVLEIQGTMPSSPKMPSRVPMWRGVKFAYLLIAMCLFPLAIGGYWAYGNLIPTNGGALSALTEFRRHNTSKLMVASTCLLVVINILASFQIYAMPVFDNLEFIYTSKKNERCPPWLRTAIRAFFGCLAFFIAVAFPFLPRLAGLIGGIALPVTFAYPCFMWIAIKKPQQFSAMWFFNWVLGCLGMILSVILITGAVWSIADRGIELNFFRPH